MSSTSFRVYGGVAGEDRKEQRRTRFLDAGLDLLGSGDAEVTLTVRAACKVAGLATRYFYESFADRDEFAIAVFDHVVSDLATATLKAVRSARTDPVAKTRAGLRILVRRIAEDPRRGRLLFSPGLAGTILAHRRVQATRWFAQTLGMQARESLGIRGSTRLELAAEFLVGGLSQTLASWLGGTLEVTEGDLVEQCTEIFRAVGELM